MTEAQKLHLFYFERLIEVMGTKEHSTVNEKYDPTSRTVVTAYVEMEYGLETVAEAPSSIEWDESDCEPHNEEDMAYPFPNIYKVEIDYIYDAQIRIYKRHNTEKKDVLMYDGYISDGKDRVVEGMIEVIEKMSRQIIPGDSDDYYLTEQTRFERSIERDMHDSIMCPGHYE